KNGVRQKMGVAVTVDMYIIAVERLIPSGVLPPTSESGSPLFSCGVLFWRFLPFLLNNRRSRPVPKVESDGARRVDPDERKLVEAARKGDTGAFEQLVRKHQRKAYAVALGMVHDPDEARDICQDAFLKAHKNLAAFEGDAQFFTWLYRIVA